MPLRQFARLLAVAEREIVEAPPLPRGDAGLMLMAPEPHLARDDVDPSIRSDAPLSAVAIHG